MKEEESYNVYEKNTSLVRIWVTAEDKKKLELLKIALERDSVSNVVHLLIEFHILDMKRKLEKARNKGFVCSNWPEGL